MSKFTERSTAPIENATIVNQLSHRTFRRFTDERLTEEQVDTLIEVARRTATSSFLQQTTILHITDQRVRDEIAAASGQPYVGGDKGDLFIFLVDMYRNKSLREEVGVDSRAASSMNLFICAAEDAILAAQNTVTAAESMGLGTVFLGSILGDPRRLIAAMELPELTYPILGLLVGHSKQEPLYRPRLPRDVVFARNTYPRVDSARPWPSTAKRSRSTTRRGAAPRSSTISGSWSWPPWARAARTCRRSWSPCTSRGCACSRRGGEWEGFKCNTMTPCHARVSTRTSS